MKWIDLDNRAGVLLLSLVKGNAVTKCLMSWENVYNRKSRGVPGTLHLSHPKAIRDKSSTPLLTGLSNSLNGFLRVDSRFFPGD